MKRSLVLATTVLALGAATATAASADVTTTVSGTTLTGGALTIAGTGAALALSGTPGSIASNLGATAITVSDLRGTDQGWAVTATYSAPSTGKDIGGRNVLVSAGSVTASTLGGLTSSQVTTVSKQPLTSAVTVATTGSGTGSGVTDMLSTLEVRIPVTAQVGDVFGGTVTYTVASVR